MQIGSEQRWQNRRERARSAGDEARTSYYGLPVVHKPHWKWLIIVYFFLGGISSASYVIATIAALFGGPAGERIKRVGRYVSLAALIPSPILLILDLGRPERFYLMLRILKLRSPMSVGTWGLTVFGGFCGLSAVMQAAEDGLVRRPHWLGRLLLGLPVKTIAVIGSAFGFFVGGYTGVLLAITAVPIWAKNYLLLGPLFLASAMSTATAAIALVLTLLGGTSRRTLDQLRRLDMVMLITELGLLIAVRRNLGPVIGRPLREGKLGMLHRWGLLTGGIGVPLVLQAVSSFMRGKAEHIVAGLGSLLILAGGLLLRYVMVMAGRASADDPQATFEFTRRDSAPPA